MTTVHMIGNAHLDPVWLWRKPTGIGEALLTCRSIADRLDEYPDFIFTRSDVWVYEQIEQLDPDLFERIRRFVSEGRWAVVGGWYIQPDCNLPTDASFRKHFELGREHHRRHFGMQATVGYNVDSFGHSGGLPALLRAHGYDSYVFMRPGPHEKQLPGHLFRWRSPDGSEVVAWRIHEKYNVDSTKGLEEQIHYLSGECDSAGTGHVMCFYGVGDHGGGPTRTLLDWIIEHRTTFPGCELIFSSPRRFFDAVNPMKEQLPVVEDELQYHAVGCYSVVHASKAEVRRTEHRAITAERLMHRFPDHIPRNAEVLLGDSWKHILFNQFHDIQDGTSEPDAYVDSRDELGAAATNLNSIILSTLFRTLVHIASDPLQRIIAYNPALTAFSGYITHEPWLDRECLAGRLIDASDKPVAYQVIQQPSRSGPKRRLLWEANLDAESLATWRLRNDLDPAEVAATDLQCTAEEIRGKYWSVVPGTEGVLAKLTNLSSTAAPLVPASLSVDLIDDDSDTWSHFIPGYSREIREQFQCRKIVIEEPGPLRATIRMDAEAGHSTLSLWIRLYRNRPELEISLAITWAERMTISKLSLDFGTPIVSRRDTVPGTIMRREQDAAEYPLLDTTELEYPSGAHDCIISPHSYGIDGSGSCIRFSLLRSPAFAWQGKKGPIDPSEYQRWTDRGEHFFDFTLVPDTTLSEIGSLVDTIHHRPLIFDWTVGMQAERGKQAARDRTHAERR